MSGRLFSTILTSRRKIFVSYHHGGDGHYYDEFSRIFSAAYEAIQDNSVDRIIDSDNAEYVIQKIRDDYITGTSCTILLCGAKTPWRKFVDWEIKATLDKHHGLIGVNLPSNPVDTNGKCSVSGRLHDNIQTGYALWLQWDQLATGAEFLSRQIEIANSRSASLINNSRSLRRRNG
jgi:hypothetical protein